MPRPPKTPKTPVQGVLLPNASNACRRGQVHMMGEDDDESPSPTLRGRGAPTSKSTGRATDVPIKDRIEIFERYSKWVHRGSIKADSPIADIVREFKVFRTYPSTLLARFHLHGPIRNNWHVEGRPEEGDHGRVRQGTGPRPQEHAQVDYPQGGYLLQGGMRSSARGAV